jgi:hypothetical protein
MDWHKGAFCSYSQLARICTRIESSPPIRTSSPQEWTNVKGRGCHFVSSFADFASLFFDINKDAAQTTELIMDLEPSHGIAWQRLGIYRNLDEFRGSKAHREGIKRALPR